MAEASYPSTTEARTNRESIKTGFDNVRKFASTNFTRVRQYVTEKAGKAQVVTEYDSEFESLCKQVDQIKLVTEKMVSHVISIMQPNPNARLEDWALNKLDRPKPRRTTKHALFSAELAKASEDFGQETQYGAYLSRCSEVESKLSESQNRFEEKVTSEVITPLKAFLRIDIMNTMKERKALAIKRLDLDAHKAACSKAPPEKVQSAEEQLANVQADFDVLLEKTRKGMKKIVDQHGNQQGYLRAFMAAQRAYYAECQVHLGDIEGEMSGYTSSGKGSREKPVMAGKFEVDGVELDREDSRKARMLYDYDAEGEGEISINSGELITVTPMPDDDEWVIAEYQDKCGKIPSTYIEYL